MNPTRLDRALTVLGYLARHHGGRSLSHLANDLGLPVSSTHDLLQALVDIGAVRFAGPRSYALGPRSVSLGLTIAGSIELREVARPHLLDLVSEVDENVYLAVRTGDDVVYADMYEASNPLTVVIKLGRPRPLHGSAVGKLVAAFNPDLEALTLRAARLEPLTPWTIVDREQLRAELARVRDRRYSVSDGESVEGIVAVATPVFDGSDVVVAAIQVSAPRGRLPADRIPRVAAAMSETSAIISGLLGASKPPVRDAG